MSMLYPNFWGYTQLDLGIYPKRRLTGNLGHRVGIYSKSGDMPKSTALSEQSFLELRHDRLVDPECFPISCSLSQVMKGTLPDPKSTCF